MNGKCFLCGKDAKVCHQCQAKLIKDYKKQFAVEELEKVLYYCNKAQVDEKVIERFIIDKIKELKK